MANDLEDSILKQNVPGRWTTHEPQDDLRKENNEEVGEEEEDIVPQTEDEALFEHAKYLNSADVPEPIRRGILNDRQKKSKTGVKGVLADYKAACAMDKAQREATANYRQAVIARMTEGHKLSAEESVLLIQEKTQQKPKRNIDEDDDEETDEDEEFLDSFREKRLLAMMEKSNKPLFGDIREVGAADFLEEIDNEDPRVVVVVHLYEPSVQSCTRMNRYLEEMARSMSEIKFLRMHASSNEIELDRMTLPILNIYKAGKSVTVLAGIAEELGEYFVREDAEWLLESTLQANGLL